MSSASNVVGPIAAPISTSLNQLPWFTALNDPPTPDPGLDLDFVAGYLANEGWNASVVNEHVRVDGPGPHDYNWDATYLLGCDFSDIIPVPLRRDLEDAMQAEGSCA